MRINAYLARGTGISRRQADKLVAAGQVKVAGQTASLGMNIDPTNAAVTLQGKPVVLPSASVTIMLNKPLGYVVSRRGQGAPTIYSLLPARYRRLKPIGRLDKDSTGLLLLSDDGKLAQTLAHPASAKTKLYRVSLNKPLTPEAERSIDDGVELEDGISQLKLQTISSNRTEIVLSMSEGKNRQIRRTFARLGFTVTELHRIEFAGYKLDSLASGQWREVKSEPLGPR